MIEEGLENGEEKIQKNVQYMQEGMEKFIQGQEHVLDDEGKGEELYQVNEGEEYFQEGEGEEYEQEGI